ncbi:winged helix-turn-helix domain-containing protein, partial [Sedimentibacter sp. B4]|uniref:winged helix-turn-helix domain-containing protein n=1 Tax=Sedimentibacter sp. B4 TaxID=304766 RepID=UPI0018DC1EAE
GHKGRTLTREFILDEVWGYAFDGNSRTLDVHINRLRDRFGEDSGFRIVTVRGLGYRLRTSDERAGRCPAPDHVAYGEPR